MIVFHGCELTFMPIILLSTVFFLFWYYKLFPLLSEMVLGETYSTMTVERQENLLNSLMSMLHALLVSYTSLYLLMFDEATNEDKLWARSPAVNINCGIVAGYMIADLIVMRLRTHRYKEEALFNMHHLASTLPYIYSMGFNVCSWFSNIRLIAELSTPFLNVKVCLDETQHPKTSKLYIVNGVVLTLSFFLCRIAIMPYYYYTIYSLLGTEPFVRLGYIQWILIVPSFVLDTCNLIWFRKLLRGAIKVATARVTNDSRHLEKID